MKVSQCTVLSSFLFFRSSTLKVRHRFSQEALEAAATGDGTDGLDKLITREWDKLEFALGMEKKSSFYISFKLWRMKTG